MALISASQIAGIKNIIQQVTDTFFVTPITIHRAIDTLDVNNEDRLDEQFEDYSLNCMFEIPIVKQVDASQQGYTQFYDIKATLNYRDIISVGLAENNETKINNARDYVTINSKRYKIISVALDGPIEAENVLIVIMGKLEENKT